MTTRRKGRTPAGIALARRLLVRRYLLANASPKEISSKLGLSHTHIVKLTHRVGFKRVWLMQDEITLVLESQKRLTA